MYLPTKQAADLLAVTSLCKLATSSNWAVDPHHHHTGKNKRRSCRMSDLTNNPEYECLFLYNYSCPCLLLRQRKERCNSCFTCFEEEEQLNIAPVMKHACSETVSPPVLHGTACRPWSRSSLPLPPAEMVQCVSLNQDWVSITQPAATAGETSP